jgi:hypothetical protein
LRRQVLGGQNRCYQPGDGNVNRPRRSELRGTLSDSADNSRFVEILHGRGHRFITSVQTVDERSGEVEREGSGTTIAPKLTLISP